MKINIGLYFLIQKASAEFLLRLFYFLEKIKITLL